MNRLLLLAWLLVSGLALSACSFSDKQPCLVQADCQSGQVCQAGKCVTPSDGGEDGGEDGGVDGGEDGGNDGGDGPAERVLQASVLLGEGGFFGVSGQRMGTVHGQAPAFAVGAHYADVSGGIGPEQPNGRLYLFAEQGPPGSLDQALLVLEPPGDALGGGFAYTISKPCDLNGDGATDLPVGNHLYSDAQAPNTGRAVVFWGDGSGELAADRASAHRLADDLRRQSDVMGQTVLCADFDRDGLDDLLVSGQNAGASDTGLVAFFWGSAGGIAEFQDQILEPPVLTNRQYFGASTLWADLDGDGLEDLAVGGWGLLRGGAADGAHTGGVYVYGGGSDWWAGPSFGLFPGNDAEVQFGGEMALAGPDDAFLAVGATDYGGHLFPNGIPGAIFLYRLGSTAIHGAAPAQILLPPDDQLDAGFGQAFAWVPDFSGPDQGALLVGMKYGDASAEQTGTGAVAVFRFDPAAQAFADQPSLLIAPAPASNDAFGGSVLPLGDLDGDGLGDFFVGMESHVEGDLVNGTQTGGVVFFH